MSLKCELSLESLRISAKQRNPERRFDESYDDTKSGGYRDLSVNVEVLSLSVHIYMFFLSNIFHIYRCVCEREIARERERERAKERVRQKERDESYDDTKSGGYRDLSVNVEVLLPPSCTYECIYICTYICTHAHTCSRLTVSCNSNNDIN